MAGIEIQETNSRSEAADFVEAIRSTTEFDVSANAGEDMRRDLRPHGCLADMSGVRVGREANSFRGRMNIILKTGGG